jgi:outer membrane protein assembly factor BamB
LMLKLRKDGADEVWSDDKIMSNHYNTCVYRDGYLYGFDGRQESGPDFRCVDLKARRVLWNQKHFGCGAMILADGMLILLTESGELLLVEATPKEYRELARAQVLDSGPCRAQIALANGKLYARDQKKLICLDLRK